MGLVFVLMTTGQLLKAWRDKVEKTQAELAEAGGLGRSHLADYEADRSSPTVRTLLRFIAAIEAAQGSALGKDDQMRLAQFFLGPAMAGTLILAKSAIRLGGRSR